MIDPKDWRLTPAETDAMDAVVETGCAHGAAELLGKAIGTIQEQLKGARRRMGAKNIVLAAVAWDRYSRKPAKETQ